MREREKIDHLTGSTTERKTDYLATSHRLNLVHEVNNICHAYFLFDVQHNTNSNNLHKQYWRQCHRYHNDAMDISNLLRTKEQRSDDVAATTLLTRRRAMSKGLALDFDAFRMEFSRARRHLTDK